MRRPKSRPLHVNDVVVAFLAGNEAFLAGLGLTKFPPAPRCTNKKRSAKKHTPGSPPKRALCPQSAGDSPSKTSRQQVSLHLTSPNISSRHCVTRLIISFLYQDMEESKKSKAIEEADRSLKAAMDYLPHFKQSPLSRRIQPQRKKVRQLRSTRDEVYRRFGRKIPNDGSESDGSGMQTPDGILSDAHSEASCASDSSKSDSPDGSAELVRLHCGALSVQGPNGQRLVEGSYCGSAVLGVSTAGNLYFVSPTGQVVGASLFGAWSANKAVNVFPGFYADLVMDLKTGEHGEPTVRLVIDDSERGFRLICRSWVLGVEASAVPFEQRFELLGLSGEGTDGTLAFIKTLDGGALLAVDADRGRPCVL